MRKKSSDSEASIRNRNHQAPAGSQRQAARLRGGPALRRPVDEGFDHGLVVRTGPGGNHRRPDLGGGETHRRRAIRPGSVAQPSPVARTTRPSSRSPTTSRWPRLTPSKTRLQIARHRQRAVRHGAVDDGGVISSPPPANETTTRMVPLAAHRARCPTREAHVGAVETPSKQSHVSKTWTSQRAPSDQEELRRRIEYLTKRQASEVITTWTATSRATGTAPTATTMGGVEAWQT